MRGSAGLSRDAGPGAERGQSCQGHGLPGGGQTDRVPAPRGFLEAPTTGRGQVLKGRALHLMGHWRALDWPFRWEPLCGLTSGPHRVWVQRDSSTRPRTAAHPRPSPYRLEETAREAKRLPKVTRETRVSLRKKAMSSAFWTPSRLHGYIDAPVTAGPAPSPPGVRRNQAEECAWQHPASRIPLHGPWPCGMRAGVWRWSQ